MDNRYHSNYRQPYGHGHGYGYNPRHEPEEIPSRHPLDRSYHQRQFVEPRSNGFHGNSHWNESNTNASRAQRASRPAEYSDDQRRYSHYETEIPVERSHRHYRLAPSNNSFRNDDRDSSVPSRAQFPTRRSQFQDMNRSGQSNFNSRDQRSGEYQDRRSQPPPRIRNQPGSNPPGRMDQIRTEEVPRVSQRNSDQIYPRNNPATLVNQLLQSFFNGPFMSMRGGDSESLEMPVNVVQIGLMGPRVRMVSIPYGDMATLFGLMMQGEEAQPVGLTEDDIDRIPIRKYRKSTRSKGEDDKCAICLSEYQDGDPVKRLQCQHYFHPDCIDPWLKTSTNCPICRGDQSN